LSPRVKSSISNTHEKKNDFIEVEVSKNLTRYNYFGNSTQLISDANLKVQLSE